MQRTSLLSLFASFLIAETQRIQTKLPSHPQFPAVASHIHNEIQSATEQLFVLPMENNKKRNTRQRASLCILQQEIIPLCINFEWIDFLFVGRRKMSRQLKKFTAVRMKLKLTRRRWKISKNETQLKPKHLLLFHRLYLLLAISLLFHPSPSSRKQTTRENCL